MHEIINKLSNDKKVKMIAYRQYYVFLVSCIETFFRDVFTFSLTCDKNLLEKFIRKNKMVVENFNIDNLSVPEILSKCINFQNINDIKFGLNDLWGSDFFEYICNTPVDVCGLNGKIFKEFCIKNIFPNWLELINKVFDTRHKVIHDANYRPVFDKNFIMQAESLFLMIPQISTNFISQKYDLEQVMLYVKDLKISVPYLFTLKDILADDWCVIG